jgi:hypothetical protein
MNLSSFFIVQSGIHFMTWRPNTPQFVTPWEFIIPGDSGSNIHVFMSKESAQTAIDEVAHKFAKGAVILECQIIPQRGVL